MMYLTGFADEAAKDIDGQIRATKELGWKNIESRNIDGKNLHDIPEAQFDEICQKLSDAGISINCFGSAIANWAKNITDSPESSYDELKRAIPRMHRLGSKLIRVMSFVVPEDETINDPAMQSEVIKRMKTLAKMAEDGGVTLVHENCNNWGGRSWEHTNRLLDAIKSPAFKLVFDTGNPVFRKDIRGTAPFKYQDAWDYYSHVKESVIYIHIKDGRIVNDAMVFTHAGEGDGKVPEILTDLYKSGYNGGISIEPHLAVVHHEVNIKPDAQVMYDNYVEYGKRLEAIVKKIGWNVH
jgi:sugar phosphate isomerase/epimerase